uniref:Uncharacterized protein n=1 Tax=uncultured Verrucomicrobiales bacterium HF0200_39L05 TaxID=710997 RepID=E0XUN0_9BACT|nr:hypothetical protein [uncultured Verrucomicrobiales bacterium HF0200_39L05]
MNLLRLNCGIKNHPENEPYLSDSEYFKETRIKPAINGELFYFFVTSMRCQLFRSGIRR